jgi:hypothetical protein
MANQDAEDADAINAWSIDNLTLAGQSRLDRIRSHGSPNFPVATGLDGRSNRV